MKKNMKSCGFILIVAVISTLIFFLPSASAEAKNKGHLELSLLDNSGNSESSKYLVDAKLAREYEKTKLSAEIKAIYGTANGKVSDKNWKARLQGNRGVNEKLYAFLSGSIEQDELKGIDARFMAEAGLGYDFLKREKDHLSSQISLGYVDEQRVDSSEDVQFPTVGVLLDYYHQFTEKTRFEQKVKIFDNVEETSRYFVDEESSLITNLMGRFALKIAYSISFDSDPPTGFERTDKSFRTSLLYAF